MARQHEHADVSATTTSVRPGADAVIVHGEGVRVDRISTELPRVEARSRFGGVDPMAVLSGTLAAVGSLVVLSSVAGAVGRIGYLQGTGTQELSVAALVGGLVVLALSLLLGGYVAGRVARYEGKRNGLLTGIAFVVLSAALAAAATSSGKVRNLELPRWVDTDTLTVAALVSAGVALVVALVAATLGGALGARYHRRVDDVLLNTRAGGLTPYPSEIAR